MVDISIEKARARSSPSLSDLVSSFIDRHVWHARLAQWEDALRAASLALDEREAAIIAREAPPAPAAAPAKPTEPMSYKERELCRLVSPEMARGLARR